MLNFDPSTHTYTWDGQRVPGVSEILEQAGLADKTWVSRYGLERGHAIHAASHYSDEGCLDENTVDAAVQPFLAAWRAFRRDLPAPLLARERSLYDPVHRYAGTIDGVLNIHEVPCVFDIKTNAAPAHAEIQLGAYWNLCRAAGLQVREAYTVVLRRDSSYRLRRTDHLRGWATFYAALQKVRKT